MGADCVLTAALAAAALVVLYAACVRALGDIYMAVLVVLPLALKTPWAKGYPAVGEALAFLAVSMVLLGCILAAKPGGRGGRIGFAIVIAAVAVKPEIVLLPLVLVALDGWRRRGRVSIRKTLRAAAFVAGAAVVSIILQRIVLSPPAAVTGLVERVTAGTAWQSQSWVFAGGGARRLYKLASTYDLYFYWPLAAPLVYFALRYRKAEWFAPAFAWGGATTALTIIQVSEPNLHACMPMLAGLVVPLGLAGASFLRDSAASGEKRSAAYSPSAR